MRGNMTFLVIWCHLCLHQCHMIPMVSSMVTLLSLGQDDQNEVWHDCCSLTLMLVSCYTNSVVSGTIAFLRSRQLKWGVTWLFWSCDTSGAGIGLMWCQQHHQWHHCIPWIKMIEMRWNIPFLVMWPINVVCLYTPHYWTYMSKEKKTSKLQLLFSLPIIMYLWLTNMPHKYHRYVTYANYFMGTYETTMSVYIPHMNSVQ